MDIKKTLLKFLIPVLYSVAILLIVANQFNTHNSIRRGGDGPLYRNLMEQPAFIKKGFSQDAIKFGLGSTPAEKPENWVSFTSVPLRVKNSNLPDLPKRTFLSPFGKPEEEFTIAILIEVNDIVLNTIRSTPNLHPGVYLSYIGENWEIYFNGTLVQSEMHLDENGKIQSRRNWRYVYFPMDSSLYVSGTNILAFRIVGDPALGVTGFYYSNPYYIDDFKIIEGRQKYFILTALFGMFVFIGFYYLILFISVKKKEEIYNLYYSIFSFLIAIYAITRNGNINQFIPNSDISVRLEFFALFTMVPVLGIFIEKIVRRKITKVSLIVLGIYSFFAVSQIFFCTQYGAEVLQIWSVTVLLYFSFVFIYDVVYSYFWIGRKKERATTEEGTSKTFIMNILVGSILVYLCGIYDVLDTLIFHNSFGLFLYSTFVFHIGISVTLAFNFQRMNRAIGIFGKFTNKEVAQMAMDEHLKPGGTPKHATVFFSDIRDFTGKSETFTERFGKEASDKIVFWLNDYLSRMVECVEKTGGTIDKFIGDAVMAHWGAASTSGNSRQDAYNCVVSALMMRSVLAKLNRDRKPDDYENPKINIGCGINTGIVTAGQIGSEQRMEYTVIGDPVNLASRLESLNKVFGTDILISESTWLLIKNYVIVEEMQAVKVKGKEKPVRLFAVINLKSATSGPKTLDDVRRLMGIKSEDRRS
jgi:class 3 adenylate cyclase